MFSGLYAVALPTDTRMLEVTWVTKHGRSIYPKEPKGPKRTQRTQKEPKMTQKDPKGTQKDFLYHVKMKINSIIISLKVKFITGCQKDLIKLVKWE